MPYGGILVDRLRCRHRELPLRMPTHDLQHLQVYPVPKEPMESRNTRFYKTSSKVYSAPETGVEVVLAQPQVQVLVLVQALLVHSLKGRALVNFYYFVPD